MARKVVFVDTTSNGPYSRQTLRETGLGGTEATTIRLAEELDAVVLQEKRQEPEGRYQPIRASIDPTHTITLREPTVALELIKRFPKSKHYLWLHDLHLKGTRRAKALAHHWEHLRLNNVKIIAVSDFHLKQVKRAINDISNTRSVRRIYNPIAAPPSPSQGYDENKLIFFSSPHKGLRATIAAFEWLRRRNRKLELFVANPGYWFWQDLFIERMSGVFDMGALPHDEVLRHVGTSLCKFAPNYVYPETFGLVFAESHSVGTPVLTHGIGAASEVVDDPDQVLPAPLLARSVYNLERGYLPWKPKLHVIANHISSYKAYEERICSWQNGGRPAVEADPRFEMKNVALQWHKLMAE